MFEYPRYISATEVVVYRKEGGQNNQDIVEKNGFDCGEMANKTLIQDRRHFLTVLLFCLNYRDKERRPQSDNRRHRDL